MWQDYTLSFVGILFSYSLIPQVIKIYNRKSAEDISGQTCIISIIGLIICAICDFSLRLYWATGITLTTSIMWLIILIQKIIYTRTGKITFISQGELK